MKNSKKNKNKIFINDEVPSVVVNSAGRLGRGVFANRNIQKDEVFLENHLLKLGPADVHFCQKSILQNYMYSGGDNYDQNSGYIALGPGSLINDANYTPNVSYEIDSYRNVIIYTATTDIKQGEQLFIRYNWE